MKINFTIKELENFGFKVGDVLLESELNAPRVNVILKNNEWQGKNRGVHFQNNRTIEEILEHQGRLAGKISSTMTYYIDLQSLYNLRNQKS